MARSSRVRSDLTGQVFGRLTALALVDSGQRPRWECRCECGALRIARADHLLFGGTRSCGCLAREVQSRTGHRTGARNGRAGKAKVTQHGHASHINRSPEYSSWCAMLYRCTNKRSKDWSNYGGRGISVCARWHNFEAFLADMGARPNGTSIERADNARGYEPGNCTWATRSEQALNRRSFVRDPSTFHRGAAHWARKMPDRITRGSHIGTSRLTESAVLAIKALLRRRVPHVEIGRAYGVSPSTIGAISSGRNWRHVGGEDVA